MNDKLAKRLILIHSGNIVMANQLGVSYSSVVASWTAGQEIDPAPGAWFIKKIHLICPDYPRPRLVIQCGFVA